MDPTGPLRGQSRVLGPHVAQRLLLLLALLGLDGKVSEELLSPAYASLSFSLSLDVVQKPLAPPSYVVALSLSFSFSRSILALESTLGFQDTKRLSIQADWTRHDV